MFHFQAKYLGSLGITQGCLVCAEADLKKVCGGEGTVQGVTGTPARISHPVS